MNSIIILIYFRHAYFLAYSCKDSSNNCALISFGTSLLTSLLTIYANEWYKGKNALQSKADRIKNEDKLRAINVPKEQLIEKNDVVEAIKKILKHTIGGVFVIGAPTGAGKTSCLSKAIETLKSADSTCDSRLFYTVGLRENFLEQLGVAPGEQISKNVPKNSVFIFDQVDLSPARLTDLMKELIVELAVQSRNAGSFHVVMLVSNAETMKIILDLNGYDKIVPAFHSRLFQWTELEMKNLVHQMSPDWADDKTNNIVNALKTSMCAGTIFTQVKTLQEQKSQEFSLEQTKALCSNKIMHWDNFDAVYKTYRPFFDL